MDKPVVLEFLLLQGVDSEKTGDPLRESPVMKYAGKETRDLVARYCAET